MREHPDAPPTTIDHGLWRFGRIDNAAVVPDPSCVTLTAGFQPGVVYELVYDTVGAPVIGLGLLAIRDCASFLKRGSAADGNPCADSIDYALSYGQSQCGRFLREMLHLGLNADEAGRQVFDGMLIHTGSSRRGEFNLRFGQPSTNILRSPSALFPMNYRAQTDPLTGQTDGLLSRLEGRGIAPKIIATNTGVEYWWSGASLAHTDVGGKADVEPPPGVRVYQLAGTQHLPGSLPLSDRTADGARVQHPLNTVDFRPFMRAALLHLDRWVRGTGEPPASRYPRIADGTAVPREDLGEPFEALPGVCFPRALPQRRRLDFGPEAERGIYRYLPTEGEPYRTLVSAVDDDGNEIAGVRMPDLRVPLATHTGWTARHSDIGGEGHFIPLLGSSIAFAPTAQERTRRGDPRLSIDERYRSREGYLARIRECALAMVREGMLLEEEIEHVTAQAGDRYDAFRGSETG